MRVCDPLVNDLFEGLSLSFPLVTFAISDTGGVFTLAYGIGSVALGALLHADRRHRCVGLRDGWGIERFHGVCHVHSNLRSVQGVCDPWLIHWGCKLWLVL